MGSFHGSLMGRKYMGHSKSLDVARLLILQRTLTNAGVFSEIRIHFVYVAHESLLVVYLLVACSWLIFQIVSPMRMPFDPFGIPSGNPSNMCYGNGSFVADMPMNNSMFSIAIFRLPEGTL